jgi:hypothetical protein
VGEYPVPMLLRICVKSREGKVGLETERVADSVSSTTIDGTDVSVFRAVHLPARELVEVDERCARNRRLQYKV